MRMVLWLVMSIFLLGSLPLAHAQTSSKDDCRQLQANPGNTGTNYTVGTSAVTVVAARNTLCDAVVFNTSVSQTVKCRGMLEGDPTGAVGFDLGPRDRANLGLAAQRGLKCIRATDATTDVVVSVWELIP